MQPLLMNGRINICGDIIDIHKTNYILTGTNLDKALMNLLIISLCLELLLQNDWEKVELILEMHLNYE
jgi:hypothetical protein